MSEQPSVHDPDLLPAGTRLCGGRYVIEACLGRSELATVYRVYATDGQWLALELMAMRHAGDPQQRERFEQEWRILRALRGLPYVLEAGARGQHDDGRPFFTRELPSSPTLAELIAAHAVTVDRACRVIREAADALVDLHARGVIHCNIKPASLLVTPDGVRLLGLGLAHTLGTAWQPPASNPLSPYAAPEQAEGTEPAPSLDVYALAVSLYEALVGQPPDAELPPGLMMTHKCRGDFEELSIEGRVPGLPPSLVRLVDLGLRRRPAQRVSSAAELRDRLDEALAELETAETSESIAGQTLVAAVEPAEPAEPPQPPELVALREAAQRTEAAAQEAERALAGMEIPAQLRQAAAAGQRAIVPPAYVEAKLKRLEANRAAKALEQALRAQETEGRGAAALPAERSPGHGQRGTTTWRMVSSKAWISVAVGLGAVMGLAWWEQGNRPQPEVTTTTRAEPEVAPVEDVAPAVDVTPAAVVSETDVIAEPEPEPEPVTEPEPEPKQASRPEQPRRTEPRTSAPRTTESTRAPEPRARAVERPCDDVETQAKEASRKRRWGRVLQLTESSRCWDDMATRGRLRVKALLESGRLAECATFDTPNARPEVRRLAKHCARRLEGGDAQ